MDVMQSSPFETTSPCSTPLVRITLPENESWMPSRFNSRTLDDSGNTILWNSRTGAMSVFASVQRDPLEHYLKQEGHSGKLDKFGTYLRDRGYIVSKETHELRQFRVMFGEQHFRSDALELILLASEDCNFRCRYCYEDFPRGTMERRVRTGSSAWWKTALVP